ncbi:MAG TPA: hypothetical protein VFZ11_14745 [Gemmatimonadaceae bacterium]
MRAQLSRVLLVPLLSILAVGACARASGDEEAGDLEPVRASTTVRVENRSFENVVVYVIGSSGARRRLGDVSGTSTKVFEIPRTMIFGATSLRFQVDPIGGSRSPISQDIVVSAGDQVQLIVP